MKWASAISTRSRVRLAMSEAVESIDDQLDGVSPQLVFAFVTSHHRAVWDSIPPLLAEEVGDDVHVIGCSAGGALGGGVEVEDRPALALAAASLPGVDITPFEISPGSEPEPGEAAELWHGRLGIDPQSNLVLLPDPFSCEVERLLSGLDAAFPGRTIIGGLASGARRQQGNQLWLGSRIVEGGAVGVALCGNVEVDSVVAQGCRPIGNPMFVTGCRGRTISEIDGRAPAEVLHELFESLSERDQELLRYSLFLGIVMRQDRVEYGPGDFLIRNLLGFDSETGALAVGAELEPGRVIQFHLRDAATSAQDLDRMLEAYETEAGAEASGALLFSCLGRGFHLYNEPNHDSQAFFDRVGRIPLTGFFCNGEIGPVQGRTYLHGYTSAFAVFREVVSE